mmetsp:Transcript_77085/g.136000  ORF Transcript_77085/g.136000 Transcript_77085/m.136000 type:complete len:88 (-) Transcript_77085:540-803(-)
MFANVSNTTEIGDEKNDARNKIQSFAGKLGKKLKTFRVSHALQVLSVGAASGTAVLAWLSATKQKMQRQLSKLTAAALRQAISTPPS